MTHSARKEKTLSISNAVERWTFLYAEVLKNGGDLNAMVSEIVQIEIDVASLRAASHNEIIMKLRLALDNEDIDQCCASYKIINSAIEDLHQPQLAFAA